MTSRVYLQLPLLLAGLGALASVVGCATPGEEVLDSYFGKLRSDDASKAKIGKYGIRSGHGFNDQGDLEAKGLPVEINPGVTIDEETWFLINKIGADISVVDGLTPVEVGVGPVSAKTNEKMFMSDVHLAKNEDLIGLLNDMMKSGDDRFVNKMKSPRFRIVTMQVLVSDHEFQKRFTAEGKGKVTVEGGIATVEADIGGGSTTRVQFKDGSSPLYEYARLCWNENGEIGAIWPDVRGLDGFACSHINGLSRYHPDTNFFQRLWNYLN